MSSQFESESKTERGTLTEDSAPVDEPSLRVRFKLKRFIWLLVVTTSLAAGYYFFSNDALSLYQKYFVNDHKSVVTYLEKMDRYQNDSTAIIDDARLKLYRLTSAEYSSHVQNAKANLQELIDDANKVPPPKGFSRHKETMLAVMNYRMVVLKEYEVTRNTNSYDSLNKSIDELNIKLETERSILMKALDKAGIKYNQMPDGSFRYFYKTQSAKPVD